MNLYRVTLNGFSAADPCKINYAVAPHYTAAVDIVVEFLDKECHVTAKSRVPTLIEHVADGVEAYPRMPKLFLTEHALFKKTVNLYLVKSQEQTNYVVASDQTEAARLVHVFWRRPTVSVEFIADGVAKFPIIHKLYLTQPVQTSQRPCPGDPEPPLKRSAPYWRASPWQE